MRYEWNLPEFLTTVRPSTQRSSSIRQSQQEAAQSEEAEDGTDITVDIDCYSVVIDNESYTRVEITTLSDEIVFEGEYQGENRFGFGGVEQMHDEPDDQTYQDFSGAIERVVVDDGESSHIVDADDPTNCPLAQAEIGCSHIETNHDLPGGGDWRASFTDGTEKKWDVGSAVSSFGSPGRLLASFGEVDSVFEYNDRACEPETDRAALFDCTTFRILPEEFGELEAVFSTAQLQFTDGTAQVFDNESSAFTAPETFKGTGEHEGKTIESARITHRAGDIDFTFPNPDTECDSGKETHTPVAFSATAEPTSPGELTRIEFQVQINTNSSASVGFSLPEGWEIEDQFADGGSSGPGLGSMPPKGWSWGYEALDAGDTLRPWIDVRVPEAAESETYQIEAEGSYTPPPPENADIHPQTPTETSFTIDVEVESTSTEAESETVTSDDSDIPYDLENAEHSRQIRVSSGPEETLNVLWGIPNTAPERRAVVTANYELVSLDATRDVLLTDVWADSRTQNWTEIIQQAESERQAWQILEILNRAGEISADVAAALILAQVSPTAALQHKIDALESAVTWQEEAITNPHREQFSKMAESTGTLQWAHEEYGTIASAADLSGDALAIINFAIDVYDLVDTLEDVEMVAHTVLQVAEHTESVTLGLAVGGRVAEATVFQLFPTMAASTVVSGSTRLLEANAKTAAAGVAHNTVRLSILRELDALHTEAIAGTIDPPDIARYHVAMMCQYQIAAAATSAMAAYQKNVSDTLAGAVFSLAFGADNLSNIAQETSQKYTNLARYAIAELGAGWKLGRQRFTNSINAELIEERRDDAE